MFLYLESPDKYYLRNLDIKLKQSLPDLHTTIHIMVCHSRSNYGSLVLLRKNQLSLCTNGITYTNGFGELENILFFPSVFRVKACSSLKLIVVCNFFHPGQDFMLDFLYFAFPVFSVALQVCMHLLHDFSIFNLHMLLQVYLNNSRHSQQHFLGIPWNTFGSNVDKIYLLLSIYKTQFPSIRYLRHRKQQGRKTKHSKP